MRKMLGISGTVLLAAAFACPIYSQNRTAEFRSRFAHESDPIRKAKLLPDLGDAEFQEIQTDVADDRTEDALGVLRQYLAEAQSCEKGLDAKGLDAAKHPSGFKQLQISLQESRRRLEILSHQLTSDEQGPFLDIEKSINEMDERLIHELFPHDPGEERVKPKDAQ